MFKSLNKGISTTKGVLIIVLVAIIAGGSILAYQYWWLPEPVIDETADVRKIVDEFMKARIARDGALALSYLNENAISGLGGRTEAQLYLIGPSNPHLYKYEITLISEFPKGTPNYSEGGYKTIVKGYEEYTGEGETGSFIEGLNLIRAQGKWVVNEVIHRTYQ